MFGIHFSIIEMLGVFSKFLSEVYSILKFSIQNTVISVVVFTDEYTQHRKNTTLNLNFTASVLVRE